MSHRTPHAALDAADRIAEQEQRTAAATVRDKQRAMIDEQNTPALLDTLDALAQGQAPAAETPALAAMIAASIVRRVRTAVGDAIADAVNTRALDAGRSRGIAGIAAALRAEDIVTRLQCPTRAPSSPLGAPPPRRP